MKFSAMLLYVNDSLPIILHFDTIYNFFLCIM